MSVLKEMREKLLDRVSIIKNHPKHKALTAQGHEVPDPVPLAPPIGYVKPHSIFDQVREMIRSDELRKAALMAGAETFDESDDFDIGDDYEPDAPYELDNELLSLTELRRRAAEEKKLDEVREAAPASPSPTDSPPAQRKGGRGASGASPNKAPASPPPPEPDDDDSQ